jgi:hypothetical protein
VPFVFATGYDELALPDPYRNIPRWEKPFRLETLTEALADLVRKR